MNDVQDPTAGDALLRGHKALSGLMAGLVLIMAAMAGNSNALFGTFDIEIHGYVGNTIFLLAMVNVVLAVKRDTGFAVAVAILALMFAQIGLGYVGRETRDAAAWHIPNGVLLMGLSTYQYAMARAQATLRS